VALEPNNLKIDLTDPSSIVEQIPQIVEIVEGKQQAAAQAQNDFETWNALLGKLRALAGLVIRIEESQDSWPTAEAQDAVVRIVEHENRPIMAIGVGQALDAEGHEVESPKAVNTVLSAAAKAGRLQRQGDFYAPLSLDLSAWEGIPAMQVIPEAHFGLDGPSPQSKAEAAVRALASEPDRQWTTPEVGQVMIARGWMDDSDSDIASLASTLSRLVAERKIFRPRRGQYQLAPPNEDDKE
jgi:hypothetical protein